MFGASGTIGKATAHALIADGYSVTCFLRRSDTGEAIAAELETLGSTCRFGDITDPSSIERDAFAGGEFHAAVSCIASRSGEPGDAWAIDHQANSDILKAARQAGVQHFTLLSAICVQKPLLAFQQAKLAFERELMDSALTWSIVRPTAFFKSLSGQIERVKNGKPFLLFGDGELTRCKPISDRDLGSYLCATLTDPALRNRILPIGGPGPAISPKEQGQELFKLVGKEPLFRHVPVAMMDAVVGLLSVAGKVSGRAAARAAYARIGRYYATESMLVLDPKTHEYRADLTPETGSDTLFEHYAQMIRDDPERL
ncbi:epimerase [Aurantiacibacter marinus]|uniref:Divinyl chlorophyllide a 8-vinyl-reductase, chloroplastic n=1 Tax=Aurantiacibacter marinus TaxID=874156 RepID=A0A0H0XMZ8_9SPHN|nr:epimerase [Aurantiacibacter marinus]